METDRCSPLRGKGERDAGGARFADLYGQRALGLHPLSRDRHGQFAMRLTGQMRLIFTVDEQTLIVEEVVDYHD